MSVSHSDSNLPVGGRIRSIDRASVHRICSGQVITDLASACKELVENALDAEATRIEIRIQNYGLGGLEVVDNGSGIAPEDFPGITARYHTSKLASFEDLSAVASFGFRGEALSSLCAMARVSIVTRHDGAEHATQLEFDAVGAVTSQQPAARDRGTTVRVNDLFLGLPVRRKEFERNHKRDFTKLLTLLQTYALMAIGRRFAVFHSGRPVFATEGRGGLVDNWASVFGHKEARMLQAVECNVSPGICVTGVCSASDAAGATRPAGDRQFVFVNGRPVDLPKICRAVNEAFRLSHATPVFPMFALDVVVPPERVDVNVTPDKRKVFLVDEVLIVAKLRDTFREHFDAVSSSYTVHNPSTQAPSQTQTVFTVSDSTRALAAVSPGTTTVAPRRETALERLQMALTLRKEGAASGAVGVKRERPDESPSGSVLPTTGPVPVIQHHPQPRAEIPGDDDEENEEDVFRERVRPVVRVASIKRDLPSEHAAERDADDDNEEGEEEKGMDDDEENEGEDEDEYERNRPRCRFIEEEAQVAGERRSRVRSSAGPTTTASTSRKDVVVAVLDHEDDEDVVTDTKEQTGNRAVDACGITMHDEPLEQPMPSSTLTLHLTTLRESLQQSGSQFDLLDDDLESALSAAGMSTAPSQPMPAHGPQYQADIDPNANEACEQELRLHISKPDFLRMRVIGQFNRGFILVELDGHLFIVDQHAADEIYNFHRLQDTTPLHTQRLIHPLKLELDHAEQEIVREHAGLLKRSGFLVAERGPHQLLYLHELPFSGRTVLSVEDLYEFISRIREDPLNDTLRPSRIRAMFASRACRSSIMIGDALDGRRMRSVVDHLSEIDRPWNCPHGRPVMRHICDLRQVHAAWRSMAVNACDNASNPSAT